MYVAAKVKHIAIWSTHVPYDTGHVDHSWDFQSRCKSRNTRYKTRYRVELRRQYASKTYKVSCIKLKSRCSLYKSRCRLYKARYVKGVLSAWNALEYKSRCTGYNARWLEWASELRRRKSTLSHHSSHVVSKEVTFGISLQRTLHRIQVTLYQVMSASDKSAPRDSNLNILWRLTQSRDRIKGQIFEER